jgi:hypothetical protein
MYEVLRSIARAKNASLSTKIPPLQKAVTNHPLRYPEPPATEFNSQLEFTGPKLLFALGLSRDTSATLNKLRAAINVPYAFQNGHGPLLFPYLPLQHVKICMDIVESQEESWRLSTPVFRPYILPDAGKKWSTGIALGGDVSSSTFIKVANRLRDEFREKLPLNGKIECESIDWTRRLRISIFRGDSVEEAQEKLRILNSLYPRGISLGTTQFGILFIANAPSFFHKPNTSQSFILWNSLFGRNSSLRDNLKI